MSTDKNADAFQKMQGEAYKTWEKAMGSWWDQVLESPAFYDTIKAVGPMAQARGQYQKAMDSALRELQLPTRDDVVRLTKIVTQVEDRLLSQEDLLLQMQDRLIAMEKEALRARIDAAEARIVAAAAQRATSAPGADNAWAAAPATGSPAPVIAPPAVAPEGTDTPSAPKPSARRGAR